MNDEISLGYVQTDVECKIIDNMTFTNTKLKLCSPCLYFPSPILPIESKHNGIGWKSLLQFHGVHAKKKDLFRFSNKFFS